MLRHIYNENLIIFPGCQRVLVINGGVKVSKFGTRYIRVLRIFTKASRKVCAAVRSGVRIANATAGKGFPGLEKVTGETHSVALIWW